MSEATIVINGTSLTEGQSMTVRVALGSFLMSLETEGLGDDRSGQATAVAYKVRLAEIFKLMNC